MKETVENILRNAERPLTIKEVLKQTQAELEDPKLCVIPVAEIVFNLVKENKVTITRNKWTQHRCFKWVKNNEV